MTVLLSVRDCVVEFGIGGGTLAALGLRQKPQFAAVNGISFDLHAGETYGIVGESGSGKTTLGRALAGLVPIKRGSVKYDGQEIGDLTEAQFKPLRSDIAMIFQDPIGCLSPRRNVKSLVTEPFEIHKMKDKDLSAEAIRLLNLVGLPADFLGRYPHQLSGGQARRIGVARALALSPRLIIADEPTAGLDVSVQGDLLNLLADLQDKFGIAILLITHNLNILRHTVQRVGVMYLGRIVEEAATDDLFVKPYHPYSAALLAANPQPDPDAEHQRMELRGETPSLLHKPTGCEFHPRCPFAKKRCSEKMPTYSQTDRRRYLCHYPL